MDQRQLRRNGDWRYNIVRMYCSPLAMILYIQYDNIARKYKKSARNTKVVMAHQLLPLMCFKQVMVPWSFDASPTPS